MRRDFLPKTIILWDSLLSRVIPNANDISRRFFLVATRTISAMERPWNYKIPTARYSVMTVI
jgi:hypothetical protein